MKALSIRQPWCWFILCGHPWAKDVENREWWAPREVVRTNILVHAAKTMTKGDYNDACAFALKAGATLLPEFDSLQRGGIVGMVYLSKVVRISTSRWFVGRFGFVLENPYPVPFRACQGQTGFFTPVLL